jgi:flagellar motor switch protein FliG
MSHQTIQELREIVRSKLEVLTKTAAELQKTVELMPVLYGVARDSAKSLVETLEYETQDLLYDINHADNCKCESCKKMR